MTIMKLSLRLHFMIGRLSLYWSMTINFSDCTIHDFTVMDNHFYLNLSKKTQKDEAEKILIFFIMDYWLKGRLLILMFKEGGYNGQELPVGL